MDTEKLLCAIPGCGKPRRSRGWCDSHYNRWLKYGDPTGSPEGRRAKFDFIENAARSMSDECIVWPFAKTRFGRAVIWDKTKNNNRYVQRLVCELVHGKAPSTTHQSAHSCGKGHLGCINGRHLSWKTPKENQADAVTHGTAPRGERSGMHKLTMQQVHEIRELKGRLSKQKIAEKFGVGRSQIKKIHRNEVWKWLQ